MALGTIATANIHLESTGSNRVDFVENKLRFNTDRDAIVFITSGTEVLNVNTSHVIVGGINLKPSLDAIGPTFGVANNSSNVANAWTNTVFGYANTSIAGANAWTNTVFGYANTSIAGANAWTNTVFGYANTRTDTNITSNTAGANAWTNTVFATVVTGHSLGLMCNPFMEVSQEHGTTLMSAIGGIQTYAADNCKAYESGTAVLSTQNVVTPFSGTANFKRLPNSVKSIATTASGSFGAAEYLIPNWFCAEGLDTRFLGWGDGDARSIVVCGVVMVGVTGAYMLAVRNGANDRSYVRSISLTAATPTVIFEIIPGDTGGTWETTATNGLTVQFGTLNGTTYNVGSLDTWSSGFYMSHSSAVAWGNDGTLGNRYVQVAYLDVYPVGVLPWTSSSQITGEALHRLLGARRSYDETLRKCRRYSWMFNDTFFCFGHCGTATSAYGALEHPGMRVAPTLTASGSFYTWNAGTSNVSLTSGPSIYYPGVDRSSISWTTASGLAAGDITTLIVNSGAKIFLKSRL